MEETDLVRDRNPGRKEKEMTFVVIVAIIYVLLMAYLVFGTEH